MALLPHADCKIRVPFSFERIYQKLDGSVQVEVDFLIENIGTQSIDKIDIILPFNYINIRSFPRRKIRDNARQQLSKINEHLDLPSEELNDGPAGKAQWIYQSVSHLQFEQPNGWILGIKAIGTDGTPKTHRGRIKSDWEIRIPETCRDRPEASCLMSMLDITVVEIGGGTPVSAAGESGPDDDTSGWFRLRFDTYPERRLSRQSIFQKTFSINQFYYSPTAVKNKVLARVEQFAIVDDLPNPYKSNLQKAKKDILDILKFPANENMPTLGDWRIIFVREYGLQTDNIFHQQHSGKPPYEFKGEMDTLVPRHAERGRRRGPGPRLFSVLFYWRTRGDRGVQLWIGQDHDVVSEKCGFTTVAEGSMNNAFWTYFYTIGSSAGIAALLFKITDIFIAPGHYLDCFMQLFAF